MQKGKLIVIEGTDGSGKTTQAKLLLDYLKAKKIPSAYISFPRYRESMWADMITKYLLGDFGKIDDLDPYVVSLMFAGDRLSAAPQIKSWLSEGRVVVCNRYVPSNIGHMAAKMKTQSLREKYIKWLEKLEYGENGIPKEDLVILLQVDPKISRKLMKKRVPDIHETNLKYQEKVYKVYDYLATTKKNWVKVSCVTSGKIMDPKQIGKKVLEILENKKII
jgi:dTMP kinase